MPKKRPKDAESTETMTEESTELVETESSKEEITEEPVVKEVTENEVVVEMPIEIVLPKDEPKPLTLDERVLAIYDEAVPYEILMIKMITVTGAKEIEIRQAWDRLYDQHLVPISQLPHHK